MKGLGHKAKEGTPAQTQQVMDEPGLLTPEAGSTASSVSRCFTSAAGTFFSTSSDTGDSDRGRFAASKRVAITNQSKGVPDAFPPTTTFW